MTSSGYQQKNSRIVIISVLAGLLAGCPPAPPVYTGDATYKTASAPPERKLDTPERKPLGPPIPPGTRQYLVKAGDSLLEISLRAGLKMSQLASWNKLQAPYTIYVGQKLSLINPKEATTRIEKPVKGEPKSPINDEKAEAEVKKSGNTSQKSQAYSNDNKKVLKFYCEWPIRGKVVKSFSQTDKKGIDIATSPGQSVKAAAGGTVAYSGNGLKGYGNLLIIKHNDEYLTAYGNNGKLLVHEGQHVETGTTIAETGNNASIHFEIRREGKPVNPLDYLPD